MLLFDIFDVHPLLRYIIVLNLLSYELKILLILHLILFILYGIEHLELMLRNLVILTFDMYYLIFYEFSHKKYIEFV
jgi:hypothetical protein